MSQFSLGIGANVLKALSPGQPSLDLLLSPLLLNRHLKHAQVQRYGQRRVREYDAKNATN